jgi:putative membrane protein
VKKTGLLVLVFATALTVGCNRDNGRDKTTNEPAVGTAGHSDNNSASAGDRDFVKDVASMNTTEIDLARLAVDRASDPAVKNFAQSMIDDHTSAGKNLQEIATSNGITVGEPDRSASDKRESLSKKQGADFDKAFVDDMIDGHQSLLRKLDSRIDKDSHLDTKQSDTNPRPGPYVKAEAVKPEHSDNAVTMRINEWAATTYPVAKAHLDQLKTINDTLKKKHTD